MHTIIRHIRAPRVPSRTWFGTDRVCISVPKSRAHYGRKQTHSDLYSDANLLSPSNACPRRLAQRATASPFSRASRTKRDSRFGALAPFPPHIPAARGEAHHHATRRGQRRAQLRISGPCWARLRPGLVIGEADIQSRFARHGLKSGCQRLERHLTSASGARGAERGAAAAAAWQAASSCVCAAPRA